MKDYISLINDDDLRYLCSFIPVNSFKELFRKNIRTFQRLKPGFRPDKLSESDVYSFVVNNKNEGFIASYINLWIKEIIQEVVSQAEKASTVEPDHHMSLIHALTHTFFSDRPDLYFKLTEEELSADHIELITHTISMINALDMLTKESSVEMQQEELDRLNSQLEEQEAVSAGKISALQDEVTSLREEAARLEEELSRSKESQRSLEHELEQYRELSKYEVEEEQFEPIEGLNYISLCRVYIDDKDRYRLKRLADLHGTEYSDAFSDDIPDVYNLFHRDGPKVSGAIGVWDWRVDADYRDPNKPYYVALYDKRIIPIQVVFYKNPTMSDLIDEIEEGLTGEFCSRRIIIAISYGGYLEGVYFDSDSAEITQNKLVLKESVYKLPVFKFSISETLCFDDDIRVLRQTGLGIPSGTIRVKDPLQSVKEIVVRRASWSVMQKEGFNRSDSQMFRRFLSGIPSSELFEEVSRSCDCSIEEAEAFVQELIDRADSIMSGDTPDISVMAQIIRSDEGLYRACLEDIEADWRQQNESMIKQAQSKLDRINSECSSRIEAVKEKHKELEQLESQISVAKAQSDELEHLAAAVEESVSSRIRHAQECAAEFIAENAFIHPVSTVITGSDSIRETPILSLFKDASLEQYPEPYIYESWDEVLEAIEDDLRVAGVSDNTVRPLSALLYSAYIHNIPILFAGPCGRELAYAFSVSLDCRKPAELECRGVLCPTDIEKCKNSDSDIVIISNPFEAGWYSSVIDILSRRNKFFILTHPFAEDIVIEPRGLVNYCVPILTELFIDSVPSEEFHGGKKGDSFKAFTPTSPDSKRYRTLFRNLRIYSLARVFISQLISDLHTMLKIKDTDTDYDYLLLLYPLAYLTGNLTVLHDYFTSGENKPSSKLIEKLSHFTGED